MGVSRAEPSATEKPNLEQIQADLATEQTLAADLLAAADEEPPQPVAGPEQSGAATDAAPPLKPEETAPNAEEWKIEPWRFALYCLGVIAVSWLWSWAHWAAGWALSLVGAFLLGSLFETIRSERADRRAAGEDRRGDRNDPALSELRKAAINPKGRTSTKPSRNPGAESEGLNDEAAGDRA